MGNLKKPVVKPHHTKLPKSVVFTDCRFPEWVALIEAGGGTEGNTVSNKTEFIIAENTSTNTNKVKEGKKRGMVDIRGVGIGNMGDGHTRQIVTPSQFAKIFELPYNTTTANGAQQTIGNKKKKK